MKSMELKINAAAAHYGFRPIATKPQAGTAQAIRVFRHPEIDGPRSTISVAATARDENALKSFEHDMRRLLRLHGVAFTEWKSQRNARALAPATSRPFQEALGHLVEKEPAPEPIPRATVLHDMIDTTPAPVQTPTPTKGTPVRDTDGNDEKQKHSIMKPRQIAKALALLDEHCRKSGTKYCVYDEGWSDERIAKEIGASLTSIANLRKREIGVIRTNFDVGHESRAMAMVDDRIAALERRIELLEAAVTEPNKR